MIVISENRRRCYDIDEIIIVPMLDLWEIKSRDSAISLATYSTERRAKEVLNSFAEARKKEKLLKYSSNAFTKDEIRELSKDIIFSFPE